MLHILILTNTNKYNYHTHIAKLIQTYLASQSHRVEVLDIDSTTYDYQCLAQINAIKPDVLITLDLAGFRFRTELGEIALNQLFTKNLNLIWGNKPEYSAYLNKKISLSMLFYDVAGTDCHLTTLYPNVLYYSPSNEISVNFDQPVSTYTVQEIFSKIWKDFTSQVLLPEA